MSERHPFSPAEFDAVIREITRLHPSCWESSRYRGRVHNVAVGGHPESKHQMQPCMAVDLTAATEAGRSAIAETARDFGLWVTLKPHGTGPHVHIQGLPPGPPEPWWLARHGGKTDGDQIA